MGRINFRWSKKPVSTPAKDQAEGSQVAHGTTRIMDTGNKLRDRLLAVAAGQLAWQVVCFGLILLCLAFAARDAYNSKQSKWIPYMVNKNQDGELTFAGLADKAGPVDDATIKATLGNWLSDARLVTPDVALQRKAIFRLYAHMKADDPATAKMSRHLNGDAERTPFKRAARESVSTQIEYVLRLTKDTWQIDWIETTTDRAGALIGRPFKGRATVEVYTEEPDANTKEKEIMENPRRIFVRDWNWAVRP